MRWRTRRLCQPPRETPELHQASGLQSLKTLHPTPPTPNSLPREKRSPRSVGAFHSLRRDRGGGRRRRDDRDRGRSVLFGAAQQAVLLGATSRLQTGDTAAHTASVSDARAARRQRAAARQLPAAIAQRFVARVATASPLRRFCAGRVTSPRHAQKKTGASTHAHTRAHTHNRGRADAVRPRTAHARAARARAAHRSSDTRRSASAASRRPAAALEKGRLADRKKRRRRARLRARAAPTRSATRRARLGRVAGELAIAAITGDRAPLKCAKAPASAAAKKRRAPTTTSYAAQKRARGATRRDAPPAEEVERGDMLSGRLRSENVRSELVSCESDAKPCW